MHVSWNTTQLNSKTPKKKGDHIGKIGFRGIGAASAGLLNVLCGGQRRWDQKPVGLDTRPL